MTRARAARILLPVFVAAQASCVNASGAKASGNEAAAQELVGQSDNLDVAGLYEPIVLDRVDHLSRNEDKVVVNGTSGSGVTVDLPREADTSQPNPRWRLVTESTAGNRRLVTFTHETTLDQFTIELPPGDAEIHYGAFLGRSGGDVMVFAWGENWRCYWGYVTIRKKAP
jgi:hypothetical protein